MPVRCGVSGRRARGGVRRWGRSSALPTSALPDSAPPHGRGACRSAPLGGVVTPGRLWGRSERPPASRGSVAPGEPCREKPTDHRRVSVTLALCAWPAGRRSSLPARPLVGGAGEGRCRARKCVCGGGCRAPPHPVKPRTTLSGGSLGSCVDEERS